MTTLVAVLIAAATVSQSAPTEAKLISVRKIWDAAPHNAFTDLIRHQDGWLCAFREGAGHAKGAGTIRVLASKDGAAWESVAQLRTDGADLRDPKLSHMPDGKLMMVGGAAVPPTRDPVKDHYSFVSFSTDGKTWTEPKKVLDSFEWLWRVTWNESEGKGYGVAYGWNPIDKKKYGYNASLYSTKDGNRFEKLTKIDIPNPTEATLAFFDGKAICLQRRDPSTESAMLGTSKSPYTEWQWRDLGRYFGGPNVVKVGGKWWAVGRFLDGKKASTVLCRLDVDKPSLEHVLTLPSGGDTSYAGVVWHNGQLWVSYYSSHEAKTSIYLARIALPE